MSSEIEKFAKEAHALINNVEQKINGFFRVLPLAQLITSFVTNATTLFENRLYHWYWERASSGAPIHLSIKNFSKDAFLSRWFRQVTLGRSRDIVTVLAHGLDPELCQRSQCYYPAFYPPRRKCICGDSLLFPCRLSFP